MYSRYGYLFDFKKYATETDESFANSEQQKLSYNNAVH